jgi:hypothetical protein
MPLVFRVMKKDGNGNLLIAPNSLGVRYGGGPVNDVTLDANGMVVLNGPEQEGMSVFDAIETIPAPRRPKGHGGHGMGNIHCYRMGEGPFEDGPIPPDLKFEVDKTEDHHGFYQPSRLMTLPDFQKCLANTHNQWMFVEPPT